MTARPLVTRAIVYADVDDAARYYRETAGEDIALRFVEELESARQKIVDRPASGSPLFGQDLKIAGLRPRRLDRFPYLIFYVEHPTYVEIWRILHAQRDIPSSLGKAE